MNGPLSCRMMWVCKWSSKSEFESNCSEHFAQLQTPFCDIFTHFFQTVTLPLTGGNLIVFGCDKMGDFALSVEIFSSTSTDIDDLMSFCGSSSTKICFSSLIIASNVTSFAGEGSGGTTQISCLSVVSCAAATGDDFGSETFWFMTRGGGDLVFGDVCDDELLTEIIFGIFLVIWIGLKLEAGASGGTDFEGESLVARIGCAADCCISWWCWCWTFAVDVLTRCWWWFCCTKADENANDGGIEIAADFSKAWKHCCWGSWRLWNCCEFWLCMNALRLGKWRLCVVCVMELDAYDDMRGVWIGWRAGIEDDVAICPKGWWCCSCEAKTAGNDDALKSTGEAIKSCWTWCDDNCAANELCCWCFDAPLLLLFEFAVAAAAAAACACNLITAFNICVVSLLIPLQLLLDALP